MQIIILSKPKLAIIQFERLLKTVLDVKSLQQLASGKIFFANSW
jgi:hypothetical protein